MVRGILPKLATLFAFALVSGCASWTEVHEAGDWTLFVKDGRPVDVDSFGAVLDPAFDVVEARMGKFEQSVNIHAWEGEVNLQGGRGGVIDNSGSGEIEVVPGIGPARVRAFHVRGGTHPFASSGVFLGVADVGTAVHELVHARLSELGVSIPLWFEEGLASFYGDGALVDGEWTVDGLACWPMRELREQDIDDDELAGLLAIDAGDDYDARENLLVHFVGWAIVFDLARMHPEGSWGQWFKAFRRGASQRGELGEARRRLDRTLSLSTHLQWLERLDDEDPAVRIAAAKGIWKLHSRSAVDALLDRLEVEEEPNVRFGLALNCMLTTGEMRLGRDRWWRLRRLAFPVLREPELSDRDEQRAGEELYAALRRWDNRRGTDVQTAIEALSQYWEE
jgi:hypothetical protein